MTSAREHGHSSARFTQHAAWFVRTASIPGRRIALSVFASTTSRFRRSLLQAAVSRLEPKWGTGPFEHYNLLDRVFAAPAHLNLARMARRTGDVDQTRRSYERFLFLWRDADSLMQPLIEEATNELANLGSDS